MSQCNDFSSMKPNFKKSSGKRFKKIKERFENDGYKRRKSKGTGRNFDDGTPEGEFKERRTVFDKDKMERVRDSFVNREESRKKSRFFRALRKLRDKK